MRKDSNGSGNEWGAGGAPEPRPGPPAGGESHPLRHQRNLFCLPRQKRFFLAFWAKSSEKQADYGQNGLRSGFTDAPESDYLRSGAGPGRKKGTFGSFSDYSKCHVEGFDLIGYNFFLVVTQNIKMEESV